ncbi:hypothetical protein [Paenibacillus ferrarius]|uniref:hypothetical protein n=1 Tax=Paenibacillus ferrarius TaxID=1469647 RepID=UPI003D27B94A
MEACGKAGFLHKSWGFYKMPAIQQFLWPNSRKEGVLDENSCFFAGISWDQEREEENSCILAGLMRHTNAFTIPHSHVQCRKSTYT